MRFWCTKLLEPWSWEFRAYPGIWLAVLLLAVPYLRAQHRRRGPNPDRAKRTAFWLAGVAVFWVASDWPLGLLGASYLASANMVQYMLYTLVAGPLLLLGTPEWMARQGLSRMRLYRVVRRLSHPLVAALGFNVILVATHAPYSVDLLRASQFGSFFMDTTWLLAGLWLWLPICSPVPEFRQASRPVKMAYLFLAAGVVPAVPAGFLTFASFPLYATYELAPRVYGISAEVDQQMAGLIMKLGGTPIIWGAIAGQMVLWAKESGVGQPPARAPAAPPPPQLRHSVPPPSGRPPAGQPPSPFL
jgi:putative membrane protein